MSESSVEVVENVGGGIVGNTFSAIAAAAQSLSATLFNNRGSRFILKLIPMPSEPDKRSQVIGLYAAAGIVLLITTQMEKKSSKSKVYSPLSPRRAIFNWIVMDVSKRLPVWKQIWYYINRSHQYHSFAMADEITRVLNTAYNTEINASNKLWHYAEMNECKANLMLGFGGEDPHFGLHDDPPEDMDIELNDDERIWIMLDQTTRTLGYFSRAAKLQILQKSIAMRCVVGEDLFKIGDWGTNEYYLKPAFKIFRTNSIDRISLKGMCSTDDGMYFVVSGTVELRYKTIHGQHAHMRRVCTGNVINSLFSLLDVLIDRMGKYITVEASCLTNCSILKIPFTVFKNYWLSQKDGLQIVSGVRNVLLRIHQINFLVFNDLLGLSKEFFRDLKIPTPQDLEVTWNEHEEYKDPKGDTGEITYSKRYEFEAFQALAQYFKMPEESINLFKNCDVLSVEPCYGTIPLTTDYMYYIHKGVVEIFKMNNYVEADLSEIKIRPSNCYNNPDNNDFKHVDHILYLFPNEMVGGLVVLTGDSGYYWMRLLCKSILVRIPLSTFTRILKRHPKAIYQIARESTKRVSKFLRQMDFSVEWVRLGSGDTLFTATDQSDDAYVVLHGSLVAQRKDISGLVTIVGEYGRHDWVGLVETLTGIKRTKAVIAKRETELARLPRTFILAVKTVYPNVAPLLLNYIAQRVLKRQWIGKPPPQEQFQKRCNTLTLVPVSKFAPTMLVALEIMKNYACDTGGSVVIVTEKDICRGMNYQRYKDISDIATSEWMACLEDRHDLVIYVVEDRICAWTMKCCSQADMIMGVVTSKDRRRDLREIEEFYDVWASKAAKELVICHEYCEHLGGTVPYGTRDWLEVRPFLSMHHHVVLPSTAFKFAGILDREFVREFYDPLKSDYDKHSDFARIGRWLSGRSLGVVLGSCDMFSVAAAIGALQAMEYMDIPIDLICGSGWGALCAALYSIHRCTKKVERKLFWVFQKMTNARLRFFDTTFPYLASHAGNLINMCFHGALGETQIEDMVIPFFCMNTDISARKTKIHRSGSVWKYTRASATRIGVHPPICDPISGGYLVDGSYCIPVPSNEMRKFGAAYLVVIEMYQENEHFVVSTGKGRENPPNYANIPNVFQMREVLSRIQSTFYRRKVKTKEYVNLLHLRLNVDREEGVMDLDHEYFYLMLYRGYGHMMYKLNNPEDTPGSSEDKSDDQTEMCYSQKNSKNRLAKRIDDDSEQCYKLLAEEKKRYEINDVKDIIENFENYEKQFIRSGQLV